MPDQRATTQAAITRAKAVRVLSIRELNRALLARQLLLQRAELAPLAAIEHLVGLQAQMPNPPYFGLWTRLEDFQPEDLSALVRERQVVRMALMRSTIHLVSAKDALPLRALVQEPIERGALRAYGPALDGVDFKSLARTARRMLDREPMTFAQLGARLRESWPDAPAVAISYVVRALIPLVQVPPRGLWGVNGSSVHTSAQKWLKPTTTVRVSLEQLVFRYLRAFGPATAKDMQKWSGLVRLGPVFEKLSAQLLTFTDESGQKLYDLPDAPRPSADTPAPVRLLPEWDNILLSHADRSRVISAKHAHRVFSPNGMIPGTVLIDGFAQGTWKLRKEPRRAIVEVTFFGRTAKRDRDEVALEAEKLVEFAAPEVPKRSVKL